MSKSIPKPYLNIPLICPLCGFNLWAQPRPGKTPLHCHYLFQDHAIWAGAGTCPNHGKGFEVTDKLEVVEAPRAKTLCEVFSEEERKDWELERGPDNILIIRMPPEDPQTTP